MAAEIPTKPIPAPAPHARTKPQPAIARFEALVKEAKISQKGETVVTLTIPWENREDGVNLALQQGIMLDFRVTRKPARVAVAQNSTDKTDFDFTRYRPYTRVNHVLHDPDGHPVCTWCIQPVDTEPVARTVKVPRRGLYHAACYEKHVWRDRPHDVLSG